MIRVGEQEHSQHDKQQELFTGMHFCTSSGLLDRGEASTEVSLNMGRKLANLDLEDAAASCQEDKDMIDGLVVSEMGGFEEINGKLRSQFASALKASEIAVLRDYEVIRSSLGDVESRAGYTLVTAKASTQSQATACDSTSPDDGIASYMQERPSKTSHWKQSLRNADDEDVHSAAGGRAPGGRAPQL